MLTTPIRREEFLLGKALASMIPSLAIAYIVYAAVLVAVRVMAARAIAGRASAAPRDSRPASFHPARGRRIDLDRHADLSDRIDPRTAQQLGTVAGLPTVAVAAALIAYNVIHPTRAVAIGFGVFLVLLNAVSWRLVSSLLDRERLITGTK